MTWASDAINHIAKENSHDMASALVCSDSVHSVPS